MTKTDLFDIHNFPKLDYQSHSFYPSLLNKHILGGRKDNLNTNDKKE